MIDEEKILQTAQSLIQQHNVPLKVRGVEEGTEAVAIYFTSEKKVRLRELEQELELQLNLPIKLERIKKAETGKIGGMDILGKYSCCAPFLRKCPFGGKFGCGYGFGRSVRQRVPPPSRLRRAVSASATEKKPTDAKTPKPPKKAKSKGRKVVRRLVIKG